MADGERRMVFDTRGRRRNVIRVVYATLALLMGASLFLVIGPFSVADIFNTANTTDPATVLDEQSERIEDKLRTEPDNEDLLLALARTRVGAGNARTEIDPETGTPLFTTEGREEVALASAAWNRYLKVTDEPNPSGALLMADAYFNLAESGGSSVEEIEENVENAAAAQQIAAAARPSLGTLTNLAIYEYFANDFPAGDRAARQAEEKAPKAQLKELQKQLAEFRQSGKGWEAQKKELAKTESDQSKEALKNPLGGLGGG